MTTLAKLAAQIEQQITIEENRLRELERLSVKGRYRIPSKRLLHSKPSSGKLERLRKVLANLRGLGRRAY